MMKQHTTNYTDTLIETAEDCPVSAAVAPPVKEPKSAARMEFEIIAGHPFQYTSDDIIYEIKGRPKGISREEFFSKGQPCFRCSALPKRYGWGVHSDSEGKIALVAMESEEYRRLVADDRIQHVKAMRSGKKQ